jgi:hypothetical protein
MTHGCTIQNHVDTRPSCRQAYFYEYGRDSVSSFLALGVALLVDGVAVIILAKPRSVEEQPVANKKRKNSAGDQWVVANGKQD